MYNTKAIISNPIDNSIEGSDNALNTNEIISYIIKPGDTLSAIARKLTGSAKNYKELANILNIKDANKIIANSTLQVPLNWIVKHSTDMGKDFKYAKSLNNKPKKKFSEKELLDYARNFSVPESKVAIDKNSNGYKNRDKALNTYNLKNEPINLEKNFPKLNEKYHSIADMSYITNKKLQPLDPFPDYSMDDNYNAVTNILDMIPGTPQDRVRYNAKRNSINNDVYESLIRVIRAMPEDEQPIMTDEYLDSLKHDISVLPDYRVFPYNRFNGPFKPEEGGYEILDNLIRNKYK